VSDPGEVGTSRDKRGGRDLAALRVHPRVHWSGAALDRSRMRRIVSLVPSLSEALVALGLGDRLVGVTEYCVEPPGAFAELPKLGGTKDAEVEAIARLRPDLVIANQEENTPRVVRQLADRGVDVWVTYPRTVAEGARLLAELADLGADPTARARVVEPVLEAVSRAQTLQARRADGEGPGESIAAPRVFCPIWRDPWMTIGADTYVHDLIELCGGHNVFAEPRQPASSAAREKDRRYPIVTLEAVVRARPDVILLPDEPYAFGPGDAAELRELDVPAARDSRIHLIDGSLVSWYGPRIAQAIRVLAEIFAAS
jgi:ABC-type hemin transport system substrate-binding protein